MDIQSLLGQLLSSDSLEGLSKASGASSSDVQSVLTQALPALLGGAEKQAKSSKTSESFTKALSDHAKADTSNLGDFLKNVDLEDGAKIIGHLLGGEKETTTKSVAKSAGVSKKKTGDILSSVGPLLLSLLGQQAESGGKKDSGVGDLMGSLLGNVDVGSLLIGMLGGGTTTQKKKSGGLGGMLGGLLKGLLKK